MRRPIEDVKPVQRKQIQIQAIKNAKINLLIDAK